MSSDTDKAAMTTGAWLHLFDTAIGRCGIAWSDRGVVGVQLPEATEAATRRRLKRRFPSAAEAQPPASIQAAIEGIVALLAGEEAGAICGTSSSICARSRISMRRCTAWRARSRRADDDLGEIAGSLERPAPPRRLDRRWARTPSRSSSPATACLRREVARAVSRAGRRQTKLSCSRSSAGGRR